MGIPAPLIEFFLQEHNYRAWRGSLLTLGKQTVCADPHRLSTILQAQGIAWNLQTADIDRHTVQASIGSNNRYVTDATLFASFAGGVSLDVMDVTDYEGANLIYDLCGPMPDSLKNRYDLIFNGSVLDNIFDPAQALRNITQLLAPNGRVIHIEMASNLGYASLIYSTIWFLDYYVVNDFADCRVYVCTFKTVDELLYGPWEVHAYMPRPDGQASTLRSLGYEQAIVVIIAEKKETSRFDVSPVQWVYRNQSMKEKFNHRLALLDEQRPVFGFGDQRSQSFAKIKEGGFHYCGRIGV